MALREGGFSGRITLVGDEPEPPYERPPLSKAALTSAEPPVPRVLYDAARLADLDIDFVSDTTAAGIDRSEREVALADGRRLHYDRLLLATGARPRPLNVPGGESALMLRSFTDAQRLRERLGPGTRVGIIGGGFIGLEVAASAVQRGCAVTVIELAPNVMGRVVPSAVATAVASRHEEAGARVLCGVAIIAIDPDGGSSRILLTDGQVVVCDVVVAGVGALPNTTLAERAGLPLDNGIAVDEHLRTSDTSIYAAGDCASFPHPLYGGQRVRLEAWRNALAQAEHVALTLLGADEPYGVVPSFWSDQYELILHVAGLPHTASREVLRPRDDGVVLRFGLDEEGRLVAASAVGTGSATAKDLRLAELLIGQRATPDPDQLQDPTVSLKALLRS